MLRKTVLTLLLAGLGAPLVWGADVPGTRTLLEGYRPSTYRGYGGFQDLYRGYKTWPAAEQMHYVRAVLEGGWSAFQVTGPHWLAAPNLKPDTLADCWIEPRAVWAAIPAAFDRPYDTHDDVLARSIVWQANRLECGKDGRPKQGFRATSGAEYRAWPEPRQIQYVDAVMEGIEAAFSHAKWSWGVKWSIFGRCKVGQPEVSAALAKTDRAQDANRPVALRIFNAYETVCREMPLPGTPEQDRVRTPVSDYRDPPRSLSSPPFGGYRSLGSEYWSWPEAEQERYVASVLDGIWAAIEITQRYWKYMRRSGYDGCQIGPRAVREEIALQYFFPTGERPTRGYLSGAHSDLCENDRRARNRKTTTMGNLGATPYATYKAWPEAEQVRYLDAVMEGIEEIFGAHRASPKTEAAMRGCKVAYPAVRDVLARTADGKSGKRSVAKLIFAAYETACREAKGK